MSNRLEDLLDQVRSLALSPQIHSRVEQHEERRETSSMIREPVVYGRDNEKNQIIQRLLKTDEPFCENYNVIPIVGTGGIGKTTLAQAVYNDEQVKAHFDVKAWVCISDEFDVKQVTTSIITSATHDICNFGVLDEAQDQLKNLLLDKRFLIVLDDIWSDKYDPWDQLQTPFSSAKKGSRVLITTRMETVAKNMVKRPDEIPIIKLKVLSDDDCWLLFQKHAVVDEDLIVMQKDLVGLFKGLPLAAKALGGLLRRERKSNWARILKSNIWSEEGGVLPVLRLSYHHLPQNLKRAFAYCSIFPKDYTFEEMDVVLMWIAEGLLPEHDKECKEDIGRDYILDLVSRSLFEPSPMYMDGYFIMHDLIHDLAQWAAGEVCCTMNIQKLSSSTRYWSFSEEILEDRTWASKKLVQVRSFAFFGAVDVPIPMQLLDSIFHQFQYLRLLSMHEAGIIELPNSIGSLKHLRLLDLSENRELTRLPKSTSKLCNLQTLVVKGCSSLWHIVPNVAPLIELQHLDFSDCDSLEEMPLGIGKLTKLQTLKGFTLRRESGTKISELKNLKCLHGSLDIHGLENVFSSEEAQAARLHEKTGLDKLEMYWGDNTHDVDDNIKKDVVDRLQPPESIKELKLKGYDGLTFPAWLGNPCYTNMVFIKLENCKRCEFLPALGQLPSLKNIIIEGMDDIKTVGPEFYGNNDGCSNLFPALKSLLFYRMGVGRSGWPHQMTIAMHFPFPALNI
ncbi:putative disease resistance RPP13-like protein 1 [Beta vulgaris subsp. vulgaris]|uniref:putative disease resistance RPP13-like protein 1 n=1 Tax=Beta vulgaris subsp. vulgaris TaxID=3555 RepID=UPI002546DDB2|nr:putative disease resistance RPP13-like protein 1 [Beta vulgaris subsp. vulgaris]